MVVRGSIDGLRGQLGRTVDPDSPDRPDVACDERRTLSAGHESEYGGSSAMFVMPRRSTEWPNAPALWVTAAGWASAARDRYGAAWVITPDAVGLPEAALDFTRYATTSASPHFGSSWLPVEARTALKDVLRWRTARQGSSRWIPAPWAATSVEFVWQHHDLFHCAGETLARRHGCPLVSYVHAPQVWEAAKWGVRRPGWGSWLERHGERPQLLHSDVVACVSDEVAAEVVRLGVEERRILVSPMAVDATVRPDRLREQTFAPASVSTGAP